MGDQLTEADIRLFVTLIRFDEIYTVRWWKESRDGVGVFCGLGSDTHVSPFLILSPTPPASTLQVYFKCNKRHIHEYPNISNYTREIYQIPGARREKWGPEWRAFKPCQGPRQHAGWPCNAVRHLAHTTHALPYFQPQAFGGASTSCTASGTTTPVTPS